MFPEKITDGENCKKNWWVNLLLVHNLVRRTEQCLAYTWFIAVVWQLHIVAPLILIPLCV